jgi:hypothetical protein
LFFFIPEVAHLRCPASYNCRWVSGLPPRKDPAFTPWL